MGWDDPKMRLFRAPWRLTDEALVAARQDFDAHFGADALAVLHDRLVRTSVLRDDSIPPIPGIESGDLEFVIRQNCYSVIQQDGRLNRALLTAFAANRRVATPLPKAWRRVLSDQGFEVAARRSAFLWGLQAVRRIGVGIAKYGLHLVLAADPRQTRRVTPDILVAYLHTIGAENLPTGLPDLPATDVVSWFEEHTDLLNGFGAVASRARVDIERTRGGRRLISGMRPLVPPSDGASAVRFVGSGLKHLGRALVMTLRGRWGLALVAPDLVELALLRSTRGQGQPSLHLFNTSGAAKRPMWTLVSAEFGIRTIGYHYSTNSESIKLVRGAEGRPLVDSWHLAWWDEQLVWDQRQKDFLGEAAARPGPTQITGPISFVAATSRLPESCKGSIAVFDVTPMNAQRQALWTSDIYYTQGLVEGFILGVVKAADEIGVAVTWKTKRDVKESHDAAYLPFRERVSELPGVNVVPPAVSAEQLIAASLAVVSLPFTSTALIARASGKPSVFFDPSGTVSQDHPARRDLHLLDSAADLHAWLATVVGSTAGSP